MNTRRPLPLQEREYREGLLRLEGRAILPFKVSILAITFLLWLFVFNVKPNRPVIVLYIAYAASIVFQVAYMRLGTVTIDKIKPLTLISYLMDVIFITMLIYFDLVTTLTPVQHNDFYVLYFLLVMRGFALFKTIGETIFVNLLISVLFILMNYLSAPMLLNPEFTKQLILIWLVILMSWFVIMIINRQKIELMEVHDRLLRAESLARVGELAAGVAHEINNPIGIIATTADYLKRYQPSDPAELQEEIGAIQREAMRCKEIVQEMLTYANPRPVGKVALDVRALNDEVLAFVFPANRSERFAVVRDYDPDPPLMEADPNLIKQALLNLYINAKQAINEEKAGKIVSRIHGASHGRCVRLEVEDDGKGIAEDDLAHIFEPFFTRKAKGTGLGLAVTQRIVETFGGSIWAEQAAPQGARFIVEFPALKAERAKHEKPAAA